MPRAVASTWTLRATVVHMSEEDDRKQYLLDHIRMHYARWIHDDRDPHSSRLTVLSLRVNDATHPKSTPHGIVPATFTVPELATCLAMSEIALMALSELTDHRFALERNEAEH